MAEQTPSPLSDPLPSAQKPEPSLPWPAIIISGAVIAAIIALFVMANRGPHRSASSGPPSYAAQLALSDIKFSQSQNFVGGTVTYMEGQIANNGDKTVTSVTAELKFKNTLGEVVQDEEQSLNVLSRTGPYPQAIDMRMSPLKPHQSEEFRVTFEHVSADWNQQSPEITVTAVSLQ